jgi:transcriptional regulator with XRE-family HTH domain
MLLKCNIRRLRLTKDITQQQLADMAEISVAQISDYENNKVVPNAYNLWIIARALNCRVDSLYKIVK